MTPPKEKTPGRNITWRKPILLFDTTTQECQRPTNLYLEDRASRKGWLFQLSVYTRPLADSSQSATTSTVVPPCSSNRTWYIWIKSCSTSVKGKNLQVLYSRPKPRKCYFQDCHLTEWAPAYLMSLWGGAVETGSTTRNMTYASTKVQQSS